MAVIFGFKKSIFNLFILRANSGTINLWLNLFVNSYIYKLYSYVYKTDGHISALTLFVYANPCKIRRSRKFTKI